jgi:putative membrane protein
LKKLPSTGAALCLLLATALSIAVAAAPELNPEGLEFLRLVARDDLLQMEAARLAAAKGTSPAVHAFADATLRSRSRVQDSLAQLAQRRGVALPTALDPRSAPPVLDELRHKSGAPFDLAYSEAMLEANRGAVRRFEQAAHSDTQDPEVKAFAAEQLPRLRDYLRMAQTLPSAHQG